MWHLFKSKMFQTMSYLKAHWDWFAVRLRDVEAHSPMLSHPSLSKLGLVQFLGVQPSTAGLPETLISFQSLIFAKYFFCTTQEFLNRLALNSEWWMFHSATRRQLRGTPSVRMGLARGLGARKQPGKKPCPLAPRVQTLLKLSMLCVFVLVKATAMPRFQGHRGLNEMI